MCIKVTFSIKVITKDTSIRIVSKALWLHLKIKSIFQKIDQPTVKVLKRSRGGGAVAGDVAQ
jgi:hypothetical protein